MFGSRVCAWTAGLSAIRCAHTRRLLSQGLGDEWMLGSRVCAWADGGLAIRYAHTWASSDRGFGDAEMFGFRMMFGTLVCGA
jgi:hypothetical protein